MVASTESTNWPHLDSNGVECKLVPPTAHDGLPNADANDVENSAMIRNLNDDGGVFAVPAVPKKSVSPRRTQPSVQGKSRKSYPKKPKTNKIVACATSPVSSPAQIAQEPADVPAPLKVRRSSDQTAVSNMVYSIAGLLRRRNVEKLKNLAQRCGRITSFHVHHSVENALNGGTSMFHDFLNRESFRPETKITVLPDSDASPTSRNRTNKEDAVLISSKASEDRSMQDLFGVLSVTKEDIKNKTSSQLMEFVKRVESNQRREAFEKQQRPAYLLKLARTQSADRSSSYLAHAQNLHRAVDRVNVEDPCRTDSSSGGESADEAENDAFQQTTEPDHFISIEHRALHRYARTRHAISTRYQYAHRQFARMEYGCQVMGSLLQRLQQKQGIAVFGDGALEDCKTSIRPAFPLHRDASCPRAWDDRDVVTAAKTANSTSFLRVSTPASTAGVSLHPSSSSLLFKKKTKVAAPNFGLNYQLDTYEATMWKERLCSGKLIVEAGGSGSEDLEELVGEESKEKELAESAVTSARGCARARPLSAFRKRMLVTIDSFPPGRLIQEDKPRYCDCYSRSLMPDVLGPVSCAICMGQLPVPNWTIRTVLMKTSSQDALSHLDRTYNPHLSQPSNRSLDILLSGVSLDFDPSKLMSLTSPVKPRLTRRQKYLAAVKLEAELLRAIRKQEEEIRSEKQRILKLESAKYAEDGAQLKRSVVRRDSGKSSRARTRRVQNRHVAVRKRRHSSVSSETTASSDATSRTRSVSVGSVDNSKPASKRDRGISRTTSISQSASNRKRREATGVDPTNYVIPYGMTAPSKIEKIQYKEIVVPKFRDRKAQMAVNGVFLEPPDVPVMVKVEPMEDSDTESMEDLSDSVFIGRHVPCELEERSRFNVPEKNTRRKNVPGKSTPLSGDQPVSATTDCLTEEAVVEKNPASQRRKSGRPAQSKSARRDSRVKGKRVGNKSPSSALAPAPKRPRKTAAEISAMFPLNTRPVRARRSTFRASPDATDP